MTLNEKIALNKKLYNENNKLFQELEAKTTQGEDLQDQIQEQVERKKSKLLYIIMKYFQIVNVLLNIPILTG